MRKKQQNKKGSKQIHNLINLNHVQQKNSSPFDPFTLKHKKD